jgi:adenylate cyclase
MELPSNQPRVLRFGVFEVDLEARELRKSGMRQKLAGQPFEVLQFLLERSQQIITREELQQHVWPRNTFIDYDLALKKAINRIREVLGDSAESPRFIETIPRRGYRFIAPFNERGTPTGTPTVPATAVSGDSIAVLPFTSMSTDPQDELFADGMTEEIINALAQINHLHVVARTSAFSFKAKYIDVRDVGRRLNVRTALLGSVRRAGSRLRITIQLVDVRDGCHLWSERYDRELNDIFDLQDEIARSIASRLKVTVEIKSQEPLAKPGTKNLEAYSLYVKGRALLYRRGVKVSLALECFKQAVALDSEYALAWAGIADAYTLLGFYGVMHPETSRPKWQEAARRALAADPLLAEAHNALAFGSLMYEWDKPQAEREFLRALELNPLYVQARDWYACFYLQVAAGRLDDGVVEAELAVESDPLSCYANSILGLLYGGAGRFSDAVHSSERALELDSDSFLAHWALQTVFFFSGRFEEAVAAGQAALAISGRHPWALAILTVTLAQWGRLEEAEAVYAELMARARREYVLPSALSLSAGAVGRYDEAMRYAREAVAIRDPFRTGFSTYWPISARLRADPQIDRMLKEKGID